MKMGNIPERQGIYGKVHPKGTMFLRVGVGSVSDPDTKEELYDLCTSTSGSPMVQSKKTGKYFVLGWQDIVKLAHDAGVDDE